MCGMNPLGHPDGLPKTARTFLPYFAYPFEAGRGLVCGGCIAAHQYVLESPVKKSIVGVVGYWAMVILRLVWEKGEGTVP